MVFGKIENRYSKRDVIDKTQNKSLVSVYFNDMSLGYYYPDSDFCLFKYFSYETSLFFAIRRPVVKKDYLAQENLKSSCIVERIYKSNFRFDQQIVRDKQPLISLKERIFTKEKTSFHARCTRIQILRSLIFGSGYN